MLVANEIPIGPIPLRFNIVLNGREYVMRTQYRDAEEAGWLLDIDNAATGEPLVHGIPLVVGEDLLEQYAYLDFGFGLYVATDKPLDEPPAFDDLGIKTHLLVAVDDGT